MSVTIVAVEDKEYIPRDLNNCWRSYDKFWDYMKFHRINPIQESYWRDFYVGLFSLTYERGDLERLIQIAKNENKYENFSELKIIKAILAESISKTFEIDYWHKPPR